MNTKTKANAKPATDATVRHYFGSTAFNWCVAQTAAEVLARLAREAGDGIIKGNMKNNGGLYAWLCVVELPESERYSIHNYAPHMLADEVTRVPLHSCREYLIQNTKGHVVPCEPRQPERVAKLRSDARATLDDLLLLQLETPAGTRRVDVNPLERLLNN